MEELNPFWAYQEVQVIAELDRKLLYKTIELEKVRKEASQEIQTQKDEIQHLINLLLLAREERNEARTQLQSLINNLPMQTSTPLNMNPIFPTYQTQNHSVFIHPKPNSTITSECNSFSNAYNNNHSLSSPPVDSFFDPVTSSPNLSSISVADSVNQQCFVHEYDEAMAVIDGLVKGKVLPEKGKLEQSVKDAGPLLQTLILTGQLPQWKNPPPYRSFKVPPFSIPSIKNVMRNFVTGSSSASFTSNQLPATKRKKKLH